MSQNNPLDFMSGQAIRVFDSLTEAYSSNPLDFMSEEIDPMFGESSVGEITLPESPTSMDDLGSSEEEEPELGTEDTLDTLSSELEDIGAKITELKTKYPEDTNEEIAKALDDATSAIDLAKHHLGDIGEDLNSTTTEEPSTPDEDFGLGEPSVPEVIEDGNV